MPRASAPYAYARSGSRSLGPPPPPPRQAEASNWHLEGSGAARVLLLDLEKKQAGLEWTALVKPAVVV